MIQLKCYSPLYLDDHFNKQDKQGIRGRGRGRGRGTSLERGKDEAVPSRGRGKPPGKFKRYTVLVLFTRQISSRNLASMILSELYNCLNL